MNTLLDTVTWKAREHFQPSRGLIKSNFSRSELISSRAVRREFDWDEECCVVTRRCVILGFNRSHTAIFEPGLPMIKGILWWNTKDETALTQLHQASVRICAEAGLAESRLMCRASAESASTFWQEMLGQNYRFLKRHS